MKVRYYKLFEASSGNYLGSGFSVDGVLKKNTIPMTTNRKVVESAIDPGPDFSANDLPMETFAEMVRDISHQFSNGVMVVNTTPHDLRFLSPEGATVTIESSVVVGEKTGWAVVNAQQQTLELGDGLEKTVFVGDKSTETFIARLLDAAREVGDSNLRCVRVVGSIIAANTYEEVVGMIPATGYERVPPAQKLMSCSRFNVGDCWHRSLPS